MSLFDIPKVEIELANLELETQKNEFWNDSKNSSLVLKKIKNLKDKKENYNRLNSEITNLLEILELLKQENDNEMEDELLRNKKNIEEEILNLEITTLLSGKYDENNAIVTIHPGAGGTESQDWAQMLYRMYTRWASFHGLSVKELDYLDGDEAGLKSVTFLVEGEYVKIRKGGT